jgi:hypothetical protein
MAEVVVTSSDVECPHKGVVSLSSQAKLTVNGDKVVLKDGIANQSVSTACTTVTNTNTGTIQCSTVLSVTAGEATKLTCGGAAVMLKNLSGTTNGNDGTTPPVLISCLDAKQTKLTAS